MFRILGFVLGSAASIAGIFFVLGTPKIHLPGIESNQARFDAAVEKLREKQPVIDEIMDVAVADQQMSELTLPDSTPANEESLAVNQEPPAHSEPASEPQDIFNPQDRWYEFWNPFRSELAAQGFVSRLEKVTGLDYRVVKVKAGVYQVGFAYADDDERRFNISQISAATGLDLPQT